MIGTSISEAVLRVKSKMEHLGEDLVRLLDKHNCDLLMATSSTDLPLDLGRLPGISVPLGSYSEARQVVRNGKDQVIKAPNIPSVSLGITLETICPLTIRCSFAVTFTGRRFSEEKLISCAYSFEKATMVAEQNSAKLRVYPEAT